MKEQKLSCDEVHEHICENLDEELHSPDCRAVKLHLNECPECASYLQSLKSTINLYKAYPSPRPSESIAQFIEEKIRKDDTSGTDR